MYEGKQRSCGGGGGSGCMGGQGYHHMVTEKGFFWQSVFSFYEMYIVHTSFNVLSGYFNVILNLVAALTV